MIEDGAPTAAEGSGDGPGRDEAILARLRQGDETAFELLVGAYRQQVTAVACRLADSQADAQDVVQEVFLAALKGIHRFRGQSSLSTWLTAITVNECRKQRRKWMRAKALLAGLLQRRVQQAQAAGAGPEQDPRLELIRKAVGELKPPQREAVVLRYFQQMPPEQAAEALGISVTALNVRLHRARKRLKEKLEGQIKD